MMIAQALADGMLGGAIVALGAIGVTFSLAILRFANFSHGELLATGAYAALFVVLLLIGGAGAPSWLATLGPFSFGAGLLLALVFAIAATIVVALLLERLVYRPLRARGAEPLTLVFASFGLALVVRHLLLLAFGHDPYQYTTEIQIALKLPFAVRVMPDQVLVFVLSGLVLIVLGWFLRRTRHGLAMRAMAEDPSLAAVSGIDLRVTIRLTWMVSAALAALAGVFYGVTVQVRPEMGINLLLPLFTAAIVGGVGRVGGAVLGALSISVAENLIVLVIPHAYKPMIAFVLLLVVLALRPQGLFAPRAA